MYPECPVFIKSTIVHSNVLDRLTHTSLTDSPMSSVCGKGCMQAYHVLSLDLIFTLPFLYFEIRKHTIFKYI
jgi:hypothetical protein